MKKRTYPIWRAAILLAGTLGIVNTVQAGLIAHPGGMVYDNVLNITWLQNANLANQTFAWPDAVNWADNLIYGGYSDWRLASMDVNGNSTVVNCASATEVACRDNELGYMFYHNLNGTSGQNLMGNQTVGTVTLNNISGIYWSGTEYNSHAMCNFSV